VKKKNTKKKEEPKKVKEVKAILKRKYESENSSESEESLNISKELAKLDGGRIDVEASDRILGDYILT